MINNEIEDIQSVNANKLRNYFQQFFPFNNYRADFIIYNTKYLFFDLS